jgi:hypothetical protein
LCSAGDRVFGVGFGGFFEILGAPDAETGTTSPHTYIPRYHCVVVVQSEPSQKERKKARGAEK